MELRQLQHFVAVAEAASFTRAAERMNIVQSGLSMSIRALEKVLGAELFVRHGRGVRLSAAGEALLPEARRVVEAVAAARTAVSRSHGMLRGPFRLAFAQTFEYPSPVANMLGLFHREHPEADIRLVQATGPSAYEALKRGDLDLVVSGRTPTLPADVNSVLLRQVPLRLVCSPTCELAAKGTVTLEAAISEPFVDLHLESPTRQLVDKAFTDAGLIRTTRYVVSDVWTLLELVENGLGIAIVPQLFFAIPAQVRYLEIQPALAPFEMIGAFLGNEPAEPCAREFLALVKRNMTGVPRGGGDSMAFINH